MKKNSILRYLLLTLPVILVSCSQSGNRFKIQSEDIIIEFANDFTCNIQWLPAGDYSTIAFDTTIQQGIVARGKTCLKFIVDTTKFSKKRITDQEFGTGIEAVVTGVFEDGELKIERRTRILLPDKFKSAVLYNTVYRNLGSKGIHIDSVYSQRILLKSRLEKPVSQPANFVSFQGGINEWGETYALIWLKPGFKQENNQGMHYTDPVAKSELMGSGMPFVDVWNKTMGVAIMHIEKTRMVEPPYECTSRWSNRIKYR